MSFDNANTGKLTLVSGIFATLATLALFAFFATSSETIGLIGDVLFAINRALLVPMLVAFGKIVMPDNKSLGRAIMVVGVLGAIIMVISGILLISRIMPYDQTVKGEGVGAGLIGLAILAFALLNRSNTEVKTGYRWFSVIYGIAMSINLLGFIFQEQANAVTEGSASIGDVNPILMVLLVTASPIYLLGGPIWLILTGRQFSKDKLVIPA